MITSAPDFVNFCDRARQFGTVALDTEFVWTKTYWPQLGIVQMGLSDGTADLVDGALLKNFRPMADLLENASVVKILHDAPQDLTILRSVSGGQPRNIFDTKLAAGFAGLTSTLSLKDILQTCLNISLEKNETRTNWLNRPLTKNQISYALDDVIHLPALREHLLSCMKQRGSLDFFEEERLLVEEVSVTAPRLPEEMWRRIKQASRLTLRECALLRELASWREHEARHRDLPRRRIADDNFLVALSRASPISLAELEVWRPEFGHIVDRYGSELIEAIGRGLACKDDECPQPSRRGRLDKKRNKQLESWSAWRDKNSQLRGIDPVLTATQGDFLDLLEVTSGTIPNHHRLFLGWRWQVLGEQIARDLTQGD